MSEATQTNLLLLLSVLYFISGCVMMCLMDRPVLSTSGKVWFGINVNVVLAIMVVSFQ